MPTLELSGLQSSGGYGQRAELGGSSFPGEPTLPVSAQSGDMLEPRRSVHFSPHHRKSDAMPSLHMSTSSTSGNRSRTQTETLPPVSYTESTPQSHLRRTTDPSVPVLSASHNSHMLNEERHAYGPGHNSVQQPVHLAAHNAQQGASPVYSSVSKSFQIQDPPNASSQMHDSHRYSATGMPAMPGQPTAPHGSAAHFGSSNDLQSSHHSAAHEYHEPPGYGPPTLGPPESYTSNDQASFRMEPFVVTAHDDDMQSASLYVPGDRARQSFTQSFNQTQQPSATQRQSFTDRSQEALLSARTGDTTSSIQSDPLVRHSKHTAFEPDLFAGQARLSSATVEGEDLFNAGSSDGEPPPALPLTAEAAEEIRNYMAQQARDRE